MAARCYRLGMDREGNDGRPFGIYRSDGGSWVHCPQGGERTQAYQPSRNTTQEPPRKQREKANPELLHETYSLFLGNLRLSETHREGLKRRGLSDRQIGLGGFRSVPGTERLAVCQRLSALLSPQHGADALSSVPGFYRREDKKLSCTGSSGFFVPTLGPDGLIQALQIRLDNPIDGGKYVWFSSKNRGGAGPGAPLGFPIGPNYECFNETARWGLKEIRITEGILKAFVATAKDGIPTIGLPSATITKNFFEFVDSHFPNPYTSPVFTIALDADKTTNATVAIAQKKLYSCLKDKEYKARILDWDATDGKGIDDVLVSLS